MTSPVAFAADDPMQNTVRLLLSLGVMWMTPTVLPAQTAPVVTNSGAGLTVLFLGDSFMGSGGGLHKHTAGLVEAAGITPRFNAVLYGGTHVAGHYNTAQDMRVLREGGFQYVVTEPGSRPTKHPNRLGMMNHYTTKIVEESRAVGSLPVLFMYQEAQSAPEFFDEIVRRHTEFANTNQMVRAPCFTAWRNALKDQPAFQPWDKDKRHQSLRGCYMNACVLFSALTGTSPIGNAYVPKGIAPEEAAFMQQVAWATWSATQQPKPPAKARAPWSILHAKASARGDVRITFNRLLHSRSLQSGHWSVAGATVTVARLADDARTLILSTPGLAAGAHEVTLSNITSSSPGDAPFATAVPLVVDAQTSAWNTVDIGARWRPGVFTENGATLSLTSVAIGPFGNAPADEVFMVYRFVEGDADIVARVAQLEETIVPYPYDVLGKTRDAAHPRVPNITVTGSAGLMFRAFDSAVAPFCSIGPMVDNKGSMKLSAMGRAKDGARPRLNILGASRGVPTTSTVAVTCPLWLKLSRRGDTITQYTSTNGVTWTAHGGETISNAPARWMAGVFAHSGEFFAELHAVVDNFRCSCENTLLGD